MTIHRMVPLAAFLGLWEASTNVFPNGPTCHGVLGVQVMKQCRTSVEVIYKQLVSLPQVGVHELHDNVILQPIIRDTLTLAGIDYEVTLVTRALVIRTKHV